ncbi:MAG: prenyltransferase/squalene oxidase repeat-containing protein [Verrucomicrobiota bacterium]
MDDEYNEQEEYEEIVEEEGLGDSHHEMMKLFDELSFREKVRKVMAGLKAPKTSGQYKYARLQMIRLSAPAAAVLVPFLALCALIVLAAVAPRPDPEVEVRIIEPEEPPELEEIEEPLEEPPEPPEPVEMEIPDVQVTVDNPVPSPPSDFSPQPAPMDAVAIVKSPIIMKGMFGNRNPGSRGNALRRFDGSPATEGAVMRALRWLKKYQKYDGSWSLKTEGGSADVKHTKGSKDGAPVAITALGLLTFLAHGETPSSPEFGETVEKAMKYLRDSLGNGGTFSSKDGRKDYTHLIATYALAEAYGMTRVPSLKDAAERAMDELISRQKSHGGFDYIGENAPSRLDISMTGWAAQALKAGKIAGLENDGIDEASKKVIDAMKLNYRKRGEIGAFAYRTGEKWNHPQLSGAAVLGFQLLGYADQEEARNGLAWLRQNIQFNWNNLPQKIGPNPIYNWYYITQVMFHAGGETWQTWNKQFAPELVNNQTIIPKAIADLNGEMVDIGYWKSASEKEWAKGPAYNTTLCALQLQVYYRYLPTFQSPEKIEEATEIADDDDIGVEIEL